MTPIQAASDTYYLSLAGYRFTVTQVQRSSLAKMQTSHLGACLWAMSVSTYHTQPFRAATVEPNRAVWVARAMERREGELGCIRGCSD